MSKETQAVTKADARWQMLEAWIATELGLRGGSLRPISGDASFRRYFRLEHGGDSYVVMDAPPEHESCVEFIAIAEDLCRCGLDAPRIVAHDLTQGFLLLSDLGDRLYLDHLNSETAERLYGSAMDALEVMQVQVSAVAGDRLPPYDNALLQREMTLFRDWLLVRHLGMTLSAEQENMLADAFDVLARAALAQPRVFVHRDYHSRNLMLLDEGGPGILDFQDAVLGPITYDLVSLLRDCYVSWPREQVEAWAHGFRLRPGVSRLVGDVDSKQWLRWFDLMGVQRHLKASGIFARLWHRDGKPGYLPDVPRTVAYMADVTGRYPELAALHRLLIEEVQPRLEAEVPA